MSRTTDAIRTFVLELDLPEVQRGRDLESARAADAPEFTAARQVVTVGAQLAEFSDSVPVNLRQLISNSMLLAQLAANKATSASSDIFDWHRNYSAVLGNIGWRAHDSEEQVQRVSNENLSVHKSIIPVLTALLGPAVAAASMVVSVLEGLDNMETGTPWITLFDRSSQHASGAKFQIGYIDTDEHGEPAIKLLAVGVKAQATITQVLFFKFSSQQAQLSRRTSLFGTTAERLNADKDVIAGRVQSFIADFVKNVEI
ncbi:hypothetical protein D3C81_612430 [compost metagenome]|jgi:hypothetical protein